MRLTNPPFWVSISSRTLFADTKASSVPEKKAESSIVTSTIISEFVDKVSIIRQN